MITTLHPPSRVASRHLRIATLAKLASSPYRNTRQTPMKNSVTPYSQKTASGCCHNLPIPAVEEGRTLAKLRIASGWCRSLPTPAVEEGRPQLADPDRGGRPNTHQTPYRVGLVPQLADPGRGGRAQPPILPIPAVEDRLRLVPQIGRLRRAIRR
jgi:hypothetical protein